MSATAAAMPYAQAQAVSAIQPERGRLTERLAGLASMPNAGPEEPPVDLDESLMVAAADMVEEPPVWRAPGNVTIEKRPAQVTGIALPRTPAQASPAQPQQNFQPAPPTAIKRPVRRMPNVEELPMVAQKAIQAQTGQAPAVGLAAQKRKVGFLERLANVGRGRKDDDAEMPSKLEPEFGQRRTSPEVPPMETPAPRGVRIDRPRELAPAPVARRMEPQPQPRLARAAATAAAESFEDDDLEIPAFLRRRAN
jgi:cell division protein FtsZ